MSVDRQPAARFPRSTVQELAAALGVHRNTISAWIAAGGPAGPPYCELQWRVWAAAQGKDLPLATAPPEQALLEQLAGAGVPAYRRVLDAQRGTTTAQQPESTVTKPVDWAQENKRLDALAKQRDLDVAMRRLIDRETLIRLVEGIAEAAATVFDDAPSLVESLPLAPDDRQRIRAVVAEQLAARRTQLVDSLQSKLKAFLEQPGA